MSKFVVFFSYTPEAWGRLVDQPGDRTAAARASAEAAGCRLEALYWMLGEQDGMVILDAPDAESAAASVLGSVSSGAVRSAGIHQLLDQDQLKAVLDKTRSARDAFRPPGT
jgi:uncharacterized protein with GYD domain